MADSESQESQLEVDGDILFGPEIGSFSGATVHVYLEDVSRADAAAPRVAKQTIRDVNHDRGTEHRVKFKLSGVASDPRASYSVRVHVDRQGDGEIHIGDCITMQAYPVLVAGGRDQVSVTVRQVK